MLDTLDFSTELNAAQLEAVMYSGGPSLVIAGAGSGKTRVLTYRIARLLAEGVSPYEILALTFTNKAAREMNERITRLLCARGDGSARTADLWAGTFHSIFSRILRRDPPEGYTGNYTIYDAADSRSLVKTIVKEMALDDKVYRSASVACRISEAKNALILPSEYLDSVSTQKRDAVDGVPRVGHIYKEYRERCLRAGAMDFDDLLLNTYLLFRDRPEVLARYKARFRHILVDEYQDTNAAQHRIICQLADADADICAVGDDAQSIYAFRGARIENILKYNEQFPTTRLIKLERNYRSTQTIVAAAGSIIQHNANRIPKTVYSEEQKGDPVRVVTAQSDREEALIVAGEIRRLRHKCVASYDDIAILYRTNAQSRSFEEVLRTAAIPYRIYGGLSFYQRKEIKDVLAYFRLAANPSDEEAFKRIINYPTRGIGATTVSKLLIAAREHQVPLWHVLCAPETFGVALAKGTRSKLSSFQTLIEGFSQRLTTESGFDLARDIIRLSGIGADITVDRSPENLSKQENVQELLGAIQAFEKEQEESEGRECVPLTDYLAQVSLLTDADERDDGQPRVSLMTVHAAKGLEFDAVFVTGMEQDLFPAQSARYYPREMEEERRLFYVAVTRAKRFCTLTAARARFRYGKLDFALPSQFIDEIDEHYLDRRDDTSYATGRTAFTPSAKPNNMGSAPRQNAQAAAKQYAHSAQLTPMERAAEAQYRSIHAATPASHSGETPLCAGSVIRHNRFGRGTVQEIGGAAQSLYAIVAFDHCGTKKLLLRYAQYTLES